MTLFLTIAALLITAASCSLDMEQPRSYALVYGASNGLTLTDDDAVSIASLLDQQGWDVLLRIDDAPTDYSSDSVNALGTLGQAHHLITNLAPATKTQLTTDINNLAAVLTGTDRVLIYFTGHGGPVTGLEEDDGVLLDGEQRQEALQTYTPDTSQELITDAELDSLLAQLNGTKLVFIDACHSGGFISPGYSVDGIPQNYTTSYSGYNHLTASGTAAPGVFAESLTRYFDYDSYRSGLSSHTHVLAAAGERELSWESRSVQHGIFTYFLLEAAERGDLNGDGYITLSETYAYTTSAIDEAWNINKTVTTESGPVDADFRPRLSSSPIDPVLFRAP